MKKDLIQLVWRVHRRVHWLSIISIGLVHTFFFIASAFLVIQNSWHLCTCRIKVANIYLTFDKTLLSLIFVLFQCRYVVNNICYMTSSYIEITLPITRNYVENLVFVGTGVHLVEIIGFQSVIVNIGEWNLFAFIKQKVNFYRLVLSARGIFHFFFNCHSSERSNSTKQLPFHTLFNLPSS